MIEDMEDKGILDKARMEGMNQGVWLSDSKTGYCWHCDTDSWVKEDGADVGI